MNTKTNCITCRFNNGYHCDVGTHYAGKGVNATCCTGELWEAKNKKETEKMNEFTGKQLIEKLTELDNAFNEGKEVQSILENNEWIKTKYNSIASIIEDYWPSVIITKFRVKPEPEYREYRPYTQNELPFPAQARERGSCCWKVIRSVSQQYIVIGAIQYTYEEALEKFEIRESHKEEWRVCGVEK